MGESDIRVPNLTCSEPVGGVLVSYVCLRRKDLGLKQLVNYCYGLKPCCAKVAG
jgi:hypothetical protein